MLERPVQTSVFMRASSETTCSMLRGPMSEDHVVAAHGIDRHHVRRRVGLELLRHYGINWQHPLLASEISRSVPTRSRSHSDADRLPCAARKVLAIAPR
jgi:hypothetical protein